jgi:hypothetical protein
VVDRLAPQHLRTGGGGSATDEIGDVRNGYDRRDSLPVNLAEIRGSFSRFGMRCTLYDGAYRALNHVVFFKLLKGIKIETVDPEYLKGTDRYRFALLDERLLRRFAEQQEYGLSTEFLTAALAKGDECYGILDGEILAGYGWYAKTPTYIEPDLLLHFGRDYIYMYKGFTSLAYRGQRLHAVGMTMALKTYRDQGFKGLLSYVEANNFSSLKSVYRMGYEDVGKIYVIGLGGKYLIYSDPGCERYQFRLEWTKPLVVGC